MLKSICLLIFVLAFLKATNGTTFSVRDFISECFYEDLNEGDKLSIAYQVQTNQYIPITIVIFSGQGELVFREEKPTGKINVQIKHNSFHRICFEQIGKIGIREVSFSVTVRTKMSEEERREARLDQITPVEIAVSELSDAVAEVLSEQEYMRMREKAHILTNLSTNERVVYWALFEVVALFSMGVWQIYYMRKTFETRRIV